MSDEPLDPAPIEARILPGSSASVASRPQMWDDALALLAEVKRLRAQLADLWDDAYEYGNGPAPHPPNPYRTQPEETP